MGKYIIYSIQRLTSFDDPVQYKYDEKRDRGVGDSEEPTHVCIHLCQ